MDVDKASAGIDALIEKRSRDKKRVNEEEDRWKASERRHQEKRRRENRQAWLEYYEKMNRLHLGIAEEHASRRSQLLAEDYQGLDEGTGEEVG